MSFASVRSSVAAPQLNAVGIEGPAVAVSSVAFDCSAWKGAFGTGAEPSTLQVNIRTSSMNQP
jgi:hypothetical protein